MTRVSTAGNYQSALLNLMNAQAQQNEAQTRVSTRKNATDLAGFGRGAESLTALKGAQSRIQGFLDTGEAVAARLETQDIVLTQVGDGVQGARSSIGDALAADSVANLMLELQGHFSSVMGGLNGEHQGAYLFAGADSSKAPVKVATLAELAAAPDVASVFGNDSLAPVSRLGENSSVQTGYLADAVGTAAFEVFRDIQRYNDDPATGPLTGKPTDAQKAFLTAQLSRLDAAGTSITEVTSRNGSLQSQVENKNKAHEAQIASLDEMVAGKTDADLAKAATDLQLAQVATQASTYIVSQLNQVSLLDYLR